VFKYIKSLNKNLDTCHHLKTPFRWGGLRIKKSDKHRSLEREATTWCAN